MAVPVQVDPGEALRDLVHLAYGSVAFLAAKVRAEGTEALGTERAAVLLELLERWTDRAGRLAKLDLDAGLDERRVRISELSGAQLVDVVRVAMSRAGFTGDQRDRLLTAIGAEVVRRRGQA